MMHVCCRWLEGDILGTPSTLLSTTTAKNRLQNVSGRLTQDPMPVQSFRYSSGNCAMSSTTLLVASDRRLTPQDATSY